METLPLKALPPRINWEDGPASTIKTAGRININSGNNNLIRAFKATSSRAVAIGFWAGFKPRPSAKHTVGLQRVPKLDNSGRPMWVKC